MRANIFTDRQIMNNECLYEPWISPPKHFFHQMFNRLIVTYVYALTMTVESDDSANDMCQLKYLIASEIIG